MEDAARAPFMLEDSEAPRGRWFPRPSLRQVGGRGAAKERARDADRLCSVLEAWKSGAFEFRICARNFPWSLVPCSEKEAVFS